MKKPIQKFFNNEILAYLFFGLATTLVSILSRLVIYQLSHQEPLLRPWQILSVSYLPLSQMIRLYLSKKRKIDLSV